MFDINDLFSIEDEEKLIEPDRIFSSLVKKNNYEYLRDIQTEILNSWFENRNLNKDTILKMNTGAGKTLVGLLMLQSSLNEGIGPAVYICPTLQLVEQVIEQSKEYGIKCVKFSDSNNNFPIEFLNNEAILVTVFDKLFNGRSIFKKYDVQIGTILLDDAHSCVTKAREKFTIKIDRNANDDLYMYFYRLFQEALAEQNIGSSKSIYEGDRNTILQVPYWNWLDNIETIASKLSSIAGNKSLQRDATSKNIYFNWPLLQNNLENCHVFISGNTIEITPHCLPIDQFDCFKNSKRRIFMSATLLDDSLLVKELNIDINAIKNPLISNKYYNIGERMILIPSLVDESLNAIKIPEICSKLNQNIIVLTPSSYENYTEKWTNKGAMILNSTNIDENIKKLKNGKENFLYYPTDMMG